LAQFREIAAAKGRFQRDVARLVAMPEVRALPLGKQQNLLRAAVADMARELHELLGHSTHQVCTDVASGSLRSVARGGRRTQHSTRSHPEPEPEPEPEMQREMQRVAHPEQKQEPEMRPNPEPLPGAEPHHPDHHQSVDVEAVTRRGRPRAALLPPARVSTSVPTKHAAALPPPLRGRRPHRSNTGDHDRRTEGLHRRRTAQGSPERAYAAPPVAPSKETLRADAV
jgi:hypothetical protein